MGRYASEVAKASNIPLLFTHHTQYDQYTRYVPIIRKRAKKFLYDFLKNFCNKCNLIIAPSQSIQRVIRSYGTKTPIQVVPNGIDIKRFQTVKGISTPRILSRLKPNYKIILYTGRVAREKNIDFIVKALKIAITEYPEVYLVIVGNGSALKSLMKLTARIGLTGQVIFTGKVSYNQITNYYHAADFFMTASKTEVHPLVLLEALASGLPIIAVDAIGTSDIITENKTGYLTREDLDEFAKKIVYLLKNPVRLNMMSEEALRKSKEYSIPATAKKMVKAYKKAQTLLKKK
jgi:1,2-diacylglycerol 3-alpha-glucosyltransferase